MSEDKFDDVLNLVAESLQSDKEIEALGKALGVSVPTIKRHIRSNQKFGDESFGGTLDMLRSWHQTQRKAEQEGNLKKALENANLGKLIDDCFGDTQGRPNK